MTETRTQWETFKVSGGQLLDQVKRLVHEGNVRRVVIKQGDHAIVEFPLTIGVVGAALAPMLAAVGTLAALLTECTIEVERVPTEPAEPEMPAESMPMPPMEAGEPPMTSA